MSRHVSFDETWFPFQHGFSRSKVVAKDKSCHQQTSIPIVESPVHIASTRSEVPAVPLEAIPTPASPNPHFSTPIFSSDEFGSEGTSSASIVPSSTVQEAPVNRHPMCTRSKNGIYKPNLFTTVLTEKEPSNIMEAFQSPAWTAAAQTEYDALLANNTWELVKLPEGRRAVGCKWIFKLKRHADGSIARYKGRLVVKGYLQEAGVDFS